MMNIDTDIINKEGGMPIEIEGETYFVITLDLMRTIKELLGTTREMFDDIKGLSE